MDKIIQQINEFLLEQGFVEVEFDKSFTEKRGRVFVFNGLYRFLSRQGNSYFLEGICNEAEARAGLYEDIGIYHLEDGENEIIDRIKEDIVLYSKQDDTDEEIGSAQSEKQEIELISVHG